MDELNIKKTIVIIKTSNSTQVSKEFYSVFSTLLKKRENLEVMQNKLITTRLFIVII